MNLVLFIHGLISNTERAWSVFPDLIRNDPDISLSYIVADFEYLTGMIPSPPPVPEVAKDLAAHIEEKYKDFDRISVIAHSLGGLVARRYICDVLLKGSTAPLKIERLLTFGTPHLGSSKAYAGRWILGSQVRDASVDSDFIMQLGSDWQKLHASERVVEQYIAAERDSVVSQISAINADWSGAHKIIPKLGHSKVKEVKGRDAQAFDIAKKFLLTDVSTFKRLIHSDYTQPLLARKTVSNKERKRFYFGAEAIPFMGREDELSSLAEMLDPAQAIFRWCIIHGSGGVGKSRLALELCKRTEGEWYAGFLDRRDLKRNWRVWQPLMPTLLVVDYAAQSFYADPDNSDLAQMICDLADRAAGDGLPIVRPVRMILLGRKNTGEWKRSILNKGHNTLEVKFPATSDNDIKLGTVSDPWQLIEFVLTNSDVSIPSRGKVLGKLDEIDSERRPLFAHLMADAILRDSDKWRSLDTERLLTDVIDRERKSFWRPAGAGAREERALALATMAGSLPN